MDRLVMRLLLDDYRDTLRRVRAAARIAEDKLRRSSTDVGEARRLLEREFER